MAAKRLESVRGRGNTDITLNYCIVSGRLGAEAEPLHRRFGVAVAGQALHVQVVRRQRVAARVGVVDARRVREPLRQRRLLAQRLGKRRVGQRPARVQALPERVHHADLPHTAHTL